MPVSGKEDCGPDLDLERKFWRMGHLVAGVDETGRGALAGPLVAAAVILHPGMQQTDLWQAVDDSKRLSRTRREQLAHALQHRTRNYAFGVVSAQEVDDLGIDRSNQVALERALRALPEAVNIVLADWVRTWPLDLDGPQAPQQQLRFVRGDTLHLSIATASILAKVYKDRYMAELNQRFPAFGFATNSGYPTRQHMAAIEEQGPCPEHRFSFKPLVARYSRFVN